LTGADAALVQHVLSLSRFGVLQLSRDQLANREGAIELMRLASLTVLNHDELAGAAGVRDPADAVVRLRGLGVGGVLATTRNGVVGFIDGEWIWQPSFRVSRVASAVGAGDCFVGTLLGARAAGEPWAEAVRLGLAASALAVEGGPGGESLAALRAVAENKSAVRFGPWGEPRKRLGRYLRPAIPAACAVLGYLLARA
jgi:sugar/nucleoside kinase (ribokinase family)